MNKIIIDASVVAKWMFEEEDTAKALILRDKILGDKTTIISPWVLFFEIRNLFLNKKVIEQQQVIHVTEIIKEYPFVFESFSFTEVPELVAFASDYSLSIYDCSYVYLARKYNCDFITADRKLARKCQKLGFVKTL